MPHVRLHAPSIVLLVWAVAWALGVRGDAVIVLGLTATAAAVLVSLGERHGKGPRFRV